MLLLALWRLMLVLSVVYELFLVFLLFQVSWHSAIFLNVYLNLNLPKMFCCFVSAVVYYFNLSTFVRVHLCALSFNLWHNIHGNWAVDIPQPNSGSLHSLWSYVYEMVWFPSVCFSSVCLSHHGPTAAASPLLQVCCCGPMVGRRYQLIAEQRRAADKCGQCHVVIIQTSLKIAAFSYCNTKWWTLQNDTSFTRTSYLGCSHSNRSWIRLVELSVIISGVLLKMKVGIRKGAWRRAWRYPAYLWSLRWVYAVKKTRRLVYSVYPCIPPNTPLVIIDSAVLLMTVIQANCHAKWSVDPATFLAIVYLCDWPIQSMICWTISIIVWPY